MATLLLDLGNSFFKWAVLSGDDFTHSGSGQHRGKSLARSLSKQWQELPTPERVLVSNVAGARATEIVTQCAKEQWGIQPELLRAKAKALGVRNAYRNPDQLGMDRWAALIGGYHLVSAAACIVDCGTALTIDALDRSGQHLGGLIMPGLGMMREFLLKNVPGIAEAKQKESAGGTALLAQDTKQAIAGGSLYAAVAAIDRVSNDVRTELKSPMELILTGGDAPQVAPLLRGPWRHEPQLVLKGMALIAQQGS